MTRRDRRRPPALATWLVRRVLPPGARAAVIGDLEERFAARVDRVGPGAARRWYWRQAAGFLVRVPAQAAARRLAGVRGRPAVGLAADVRLAARTLRKRPGLAATAILILAIAVGANTTMFSVVDGILRQPLPYAEPDRLVMLWDVYPPEARMGDVAPVTLQHYHLWEAQTDLFSAVGAYESTSMAVEQGGWPERLDGAQVSSSLLPMLGARAAVGRLFVPEDELDGAEPVALLSHRLWQDRFGGDPAIVGTRVALSGTPTRVIGVVAEGFWFYDPYAEIRSVSGRNAEAARFWTPLPREGQYEGAETYPAHRVIARLADGVSVETAAAAAETRRAAMPATSSGSGATVKLLPLNEQVVGEARPRLTWLAAAVALVLLVACVNLVSLLLVHLDSRRSEFAVRVALGAGRGRLIRQLAVEGALLGLAGGVAGLVVAGLTTAWLVALVPRGLPLAHRVQLDGTVAAFCLALAVAAGLAISLAAALRLDHRRLAGSMAAGPRTATGSRRTRRLHGTLVAAEVALSLVLLIGATLLLRSLVGLHATDTGFDARGVLTFEALTIPSEDGSPPSAFLQALDDRLAGLPGVEAAGATTALPFSRWRQFALVSIEGAGLDPDDPPRVDHRYVTPGYFDAVGLPLRAGRAFTPDDREGAPPVAIVNQAFAARFLPGPDGPVGRVVTLIRGRTAVAHTVVGLVATVKHDRLVEPDLPIVYAPARQSSFRLSFQRFAVRTALPDPTALTESIRRAAADIDPRQPLQKFMTFEALVGQSIEEETFYAEVLGAFAGTAVVLTLIGLYGVVSFATRQRDREVGIRMALGAGAGRVRRLVLGEGLAPVAVGLTLGWIGALATGRLLRGLLHGVPEQDALSFATATIAFALAAIAACLVPTRRATRIDPVRVLRGE